jgi:hypothetical protein
VEANGDAKLLKTIEQKLAARKVERSLCIFSIKRGGRVRNLEKSCYSAAFPRSAQLMSSFFLRSSLTTILLLLSLQTIAMLGDETKPVAINSELAAADQLYRAGKFAEAEVNYQVLLKTDANLVPAQVGLVRAMLRQQKY